MTRRLFIIGTGGFAKEVAQLACEINHVGLTRWSTIDYLCERSEEIGRVMPFGRVVGTDALLQKINEPTDFSIGIGIPEVRRRIAGKLERQPLLTAPNLIHPSAGFAPAHVQLGQGNIITRGTVFTCDIVVGDFNIFNLNSTVGHDCRIGSFNVVNPGCNISGGVQLANGCLLGTGCQVLEGLSITSNVTVGGGALVSKHVTQVGVYVGVPARLLR